MRPRRASATTGWRRIATALWRWPADPQIYGRLDVEAAPLLDAIERIRQRTGVRISVTHLVVRALAHALHDHPEVNTALRFGRFVPRAGVDVFVIVSTGAGSDLSGVKVVDADRKDVVAVAREISEEAAGVRAGRRSDLERGKRLLQLLPLPVLRRVLRLAAFLTADLGWDLKRIGLSREAFGSAMVSSVGMFGLTEGWAPLSPLYRVPLVVLVGAVRPSAWVVADAVTVRPMLPVTVTIDHRWVDGHQIARLAESFGAYLANPLRFEPPGIAKTAPAGGRTLRGVGV